jgi:hypothetical protein
VRGDLVVVFLLGERVIEEKDRIARRSLVAFQQGTDHVEVERIGNLPERLGERARLRLGDALIRFGVIVQV